jgi:hypothetical protein
MAPVDAFSDSTSSTARATVHGSTATTDKRSESIPSASPVTGAGISLSLQAALELFFESQKEATHQYKSSESTVGSGSDVQPTKSEKLKL